MQKKIVPLTENYQFRRAYSRGKNIVGPLAVLYILRTGRPETRLGLTTSKKIGNAVLRSRSRRVLREAFRPFLPRLRPGYDLVLVARGKTPFGKSTRLSAWLEPRLLEAGVLRPDQAGEKGGAPS